MSTETKLDWADDAAADAQAPATGNPPDAASATSTAPQETANSVENSQTDGASEWQMGSSLLEPEFDVNVKLNDLQADPNNPLYSAKSFADLNL